ncbi:hypothetical protein N3K66_007106 [Trichothecium roseum]|uniref:Uncharacterized protein n=1 Tax=Trichothecium roseum TaxID=47278 RepID=A0ACC0UX77_9HYPO|nr:hypothetical protein N3K66_007106 [Trichothecium roseum]
MENVRDDAAASGDPTAPASINERGQLDEQQQQQQQQQEPPQHRHNYHQGDWDQHQHQSRKPIERGVTAEDPGTASPTKSRNPSVTTVPGADSDANTLASSAPETTPAEPKLDPAQDTTEPPPQFEPVAVPAIVAPSSYLRPRATTLQRVTMAATPEIIEPPPQPTLADKEQAQGLKSIREFLKVRTSYDVTPMSFRLIVLDTDLLIKKSLNILIQNSIVSAPLWNSHTSRFAGILTSTDFLNVIQYYWQFPDEMSKLDQFKLSSLRDIERAIGAVPIETLSVHPLKPLFEACSRMLKTRARRIPLLDVDGETGKEMVVSVITQYRILKFIAVNNERNTVLLKKSLAELKIGTYTNIATTRMDSTVLDVVHDMVEKNISCVPVIDKDNRLLNVFEAVDVIPCIRGGVYEELDGSVAEALCKRPDDSPGIYTCSENDRLDAIFDSIRKSRVHRLIVIDDDNKLRGVISLSDILNYILLTGDESMAE